MNLSLTRHLIKRPFFETSVQLPTSNLRASVTSTDKSKALRSRLRSGHYDDGCAAYGESSLLDLTLVSEEWWSSTGASIDTIRSDFPLDTNCVHKYTIHVGRRCDRGARKGSITSIHPRRRMFVLWQFANLREDRAAACIEDARCCGDAPKEKERHFNERLADASSLKRRVDRALRRRETHGDALFRGFFPRSSSPILHSGVLPTW